MIRSLIVICVFFVFGSCDPVLGQTDYSIPEIVLNEGNLKDALLKYYKDNFSNKSKGLITVHANRKNDITTFLISSQLSGNVEIPSYLSKIEAFPILFYTGLKGQIKRDSNDISNFREAISSKLEVYSENSDGEIIQIPPNYNPEVIMLTFVKDKFVSSKTVN